MDPHAIAAIAIVFAIIPVSWAIGVLVAHHLNRRDRKKERNS